MTGTPLGVLVGRLAQADPDRPAVSCDAVTISRAELEARTNRLARVYRPKGLGGLRGPRRAVVRIPGHVPHLLPARRRGEPELRGDRIPYL